MANPGSPLDRITGIMPDIWRPPPSLRAQRRPPDLGLRSASCLRAPFHVGYRGRAVSPRLEPATKVATM